MKSSPNRKRGSIGIALLLIGVLCVGESDATEIIWDTWGVPHIYADTEAEMFYALGWAQMHNHGDRIVQLMGRSRGRGAEYWGESHLANDQLIHTLGLPELARTWTETQNADHKKLCHEFVKGMNNYARQHPESIDASNRVVLPITLEDINSHSLFIFYTRFVGGRELGRASRWGETGSNAYAIGPDRSASGNAMLVQNPHLPWDQEFTFMELHAVAPGINIYGVNLIGLPGFGIAFNENLGWSHTDNTIDNADSYELTLQDNGYLLDGKVVPFERHTKTIQIKTDQGMVKKSIEVLRSRHGFVIKQGDKKAVAIRFPATDRVDAGFQWYQMAKASDFTEFEDALKQEQLPFWNVMYADRFGDIFYLFNGHVPKRDSGDWAFWDRLIPGNESKYIWDEVHTYDELPKLKNPVCGWLQNANDPPWWCTCPCEVHAKDFPDYMAPTQVPYYFRPQRSARMVVEDESISFDELVGYKMSTRVEMADRLMGDLAVAVKDHGDEIAKEAMVVLQNWDRCAEVDSQGALLFLYWAQGINPFNPGTYDKSWDVNQHLSTPDGLADPAAAAKQLSVAANQMKAAGIALDVPWGEMARARVGKHDLPSNGINGVLGVFRVATMGPAGDGKLSVQHGDSWVAVIEFGEKIRAKVLLSYGNASQLGSPHHGDQLKLFSKKQLRDAWFYRDDIEKHIEKREVLQDGSFVFSSK